MNGSGALAEIMFREAQERCYRGRRYALCVYLVVGFTEMVRGNRKVATVLRSSLVSTVIGQPVCGLPVRVQRRAGRRARASLVVMEEERWVEAWP